MTKILHFVIWQKKNPLWFDEKTTFWFDKKTTLYFDEKNCLVTRYLDVIDQHFFFQIFLASKSGNYGHVPHNDWLTIPLYFSGVCAHLCTYFLASLPPKRAISFQRSQLQRSAALESPLRPRLLHTSKASTQLQLCSVPSDFWWLFAYVCQREKELGLAAKV